MLQVGLELWVCWWWDGWVSGWVGAGRLATAKGVGVGVGCWGVARGFWT